MKQAVKKGGRTLTLRFAADKRRTSKQIGTVMAVFNILAEERQTVLENLDITREIEDVGEVDAEGVNELWSVSYFLYFSQTHSI